MQAFSRQCKSGRAWRRVGGQGLRFLLRGRQLRRQTTPETTGCRSCCPGGEQAGDLSQRRPEVGARCSARWGSPQCQRQSSLHRQRSQRGCQHWCHQRPFRSTKTQVPENTVRTFSLHSLSFRRIQGGKCRSRGRHSIVHNLRLHWPAQTAPTSMRSLGSSLKPILRALLR